MALPLPAVPAGSRIAVEPVADGIRITLPALLTELGCFVPAAFICFRLCGWAAGEIFAVKALFGEFGKGGELEKGGEFPFFAKLFLIGWLGGWTIGGLAAMQAAYSLLRPARSGRLVLTPDQLVYLPPSAALIRTLSHWVKRRQDGEPFSPAPRKSSSSTRKRVSRLERIGELLRHS